MTRFIKKRNGIKPNRKSRIAEKKSSQKVNYPTTSGSDITMCKGDECPFKGMCHRYTALPDELYQSYFTKPPFKINKGKPSCEMFWGEAANNLFIVLKELMSDRDKKNTKETPKKRKRNSKSK